MGFWDAGSTLTNGFWPTHVTSVRRLSNFVWSGSIDGLLVWQIKLISFSLAHSVFKTRVIASKRAKLIISSCICFLFLQLKEEVVSAQQQLKTLCSQLRQSQHGSSASASSRMPRGHASLNSAGGEAGSASAVVGQGATSSNSSSSNLDPVSVNCAASVASRYRYHHFQSF